MEFYIYNYDITENTEKEELNSDFSLLDTDPEELAIQWSFGDMKLFTMMSEMELLTFQENSYYSKIINRGKKFSRWLASELIIEENLEKRVRILSHFISLAINLLDYDNYNGLMWFWEGYSSLTVKDLINPLLSKLPDKVLDAIKSLEQKLSFDNHMLVRTSEEAGLKQNRPVIPWLKPLRDQIEKIEEIEDDFILHPTSNTPMINFGKLWKLNDQINLFRECNDMAKLFIIDNKNPSAKRYEEFFQNKIEELSIILRFSNLN